MTFTRRQVLGGLAGLAVVGLGAGGARLWLARPQVAQEYDYELIAAPLDLEIVPGFSSPALAYGGQCPGVELRAKQGEWLRVRFTNRLDEPTTIHWHGIRLPIEMDGVPYISQPPVQPGESFIYQFKTQDAGSYWYHPHLAEQLAQAAEDQQDQGEAEAHQQSVEAGAQHAVLRREGLGAAEDHAVGGDQRDEDAEDLVQLVGPGLHQQFDAGGQRGDDHDERRQPDRLAHRAAHQRYRGIGAGQHEHGGQAQAEGDRKSVV